MQKVMSDYLDEVCSSIGGKALKQSVRNELSDHINERYAEFIKEGLEDDEAARRAVSQMGDPKEIGVKIKKANNKKTDMITLCTGAVIFVLFLIYILHTSGVQISFLIEIPGLLGVSGLTAAFGFLGCGGKPTVIKFIHAAKSGAIYSGILCSVINIITMLYGMAENPEKLGFNLAMSLLSIFYGVLISSGLRIAELRLKGAEHKKIKELLE